MQKLLIYIVGKFSLYCVFTLLLTPPKIGVDFTLIFTLSGTVISIPPKIALAFITWSCAIFAFFKS